MKTGAWLAGILTTGELFLWNKDQDYLKIVPAVEESSKVVTAAQGRTLQFVFFITIKNRKQMLTRKIFLLMIKFYLINNDNFYLAEERVVNLISILGMPS